MELLDYKSLGAAIKSVYVESDKYQLSKDVPTFELNGKYVGDFFNFTMFEPDGENAPIFYHIFSPYDVISGKSAQQAAVFRAGEMIMSADFTPYMQQRTGVMSALVLAALGANALDSKKVIYLGTGAIARCDLEALKAHFPEIREISYVNKSGKAADFGVTAKRLGLAVREGSLVEIGDYDVIICHTNSKEPVLTAAMRDSIKAGAVILVFSSEDATEVASEYFDSSEANILVDWDQTLDEAPELKAAVERGLAKKDEIVRLRELFVEGVGSKRTKKYTIYRTHGTPMQNLAAMKLLMQRL